MDKLIAPTGMSFHDFAAGTGYAQEKRYKKYEEKGFGTFSGKVELVPSILTRLGYDPLGGYREPPWSPVSTPELARDYPLILISGSRVRAYHHSSHRQIANLRKRYPEPLLQINPQTAAGLGIGEGDTVWIETPLGRITQKAQLLERMAPSVVHADGYWWYPEKSEAEPSLFGVWESNIDSILPDDISPSAFLQPSQLLTIPQHNFETTSGQHLLPDSEVVSSPSAVDFNPEEFIQATQGKLQSHNEWHRSTGFIRGAEIVQKVAIENSINPKLLLALLEYESGWVYGNPQTSDLETFPLGFVDQRERGLYNQLVWAVNQLSIGYYAWREGRLTELTFLDGSTVRLAPELNAGTVALMYYFSKKYQGDAWLQALDLETGLPAVHTNMRW